MNADFLLNRIETIAKEWEQELIRSGKPVTADRGYDDKRKWGQPPLVCVSRGGVDVDAMICNYYHVRVKVDDVLCAWAGFEAALKDSTGYRLPRIRQEFNRLFPNYRFGTDQNHPSELAAQFMKLVSFDGYPLRVVPEACVLDLNGKEIGLDRRAILGVESSYRTRMVCRNFKSSLEHFNVFGGCQSHYPQTNPTSLLLVQGLPRRRQEILAVFSLAIHLGPEFEKLLLEPFYIGMDLFDAKPIDDVFLVARTLILTSKISPLKQLSSLLIPHVGSRDFQKYFGTNYSRTPATYTAAAQAKYLSALDGLSQQVTCNPTKSSKDSLLSHFFGL